MFPWNPELGCPLQGEIIPCSCLTWGLSKVGRERGLLGPGEELGLELGKAGKV